MSVNNMSDTNNQLQYSIPAFLWDNNKRLSGMLELWNMEIVFRLDDFQQGHLCLHIPLNLIDKVEVFLIYNISRYGLKVQSKEGKFDLFVMEEASLFKEKLERELLEKGKTNMGI